MTEDTYYGTGYGETTYFLALNNGELVNFGHTEGGAKVNSDDDKIETLKYLVACQQEIEPLLNALEEFLNEQCEICTEKDTLCKACSTADLKAKCAGIKIKLSC